MSENVSYMKRKKRFYYYNLTDSVSIKHRILTKNVCKYNSIMCKRMTVHLYPNKQKQFLKTVKTAPNQQKRDFHSTKQRFYYHNLIDSVLIKCRILTNIYLSIYASIQQESESIFALPQANTF